MRLLAVSYMLPPMLWPQAIQIGRLIANTTGEIGVVCGTVQKLSSGMDAAADFNRRLAFRVEVPHRPFFKGFAHRLARNFLPVYGCTPDEFRGWVDKALPEVLRTMDEKKFTPDAILSFGEPMSDHILGYLLKKRLNKAWVAHFSDPWVDNPMRRRQPLSNMLDRRWERRVVTHADRVIFTSQETVEMVMRKYPKSFVDKVAVLPHSFDPSLYPAERAEHGEQIVVRYLGNFYGHRTPLPLFKALEYLVIHDPTILEGVRFELVGSVPSRMLWHPSFKRLPPGLLEVVPPVPYSESLRMMVASDLLLVIDGAASISVFLPSKLVDYLGAGVPIFGIVPPGASASLITRMGGSVADPADTAAVVLGLSAAIASVRKRRDICGSMPWGEQSVRREYAVGAVVSRFNELVRDTITPSSCTSTKGR